MMFQVNDQVVHATCGVGRIVGLVTRSFAPGESRLYYEVSGQRGTAWVPADDGPAAGLRALAGVSDLVHFRGVLSGRPANLHADFRQRQLDVRRRLKSATLQDVCEVVRDLAGRGWLKPLNEADANLLRVTTAALCDEWAAAAGITAGQAAAEVSALLNQGRQTYQS